MRRIVFYPTPVTVMATYYILFALVGSSMPILAFGKKGTA